MPFFHRASLLVALLIIAVLILPTESKRFSSSPSKSNSKPSSSSSSSSKKKAAAAAATAIAAAKKKNKKNKKSKNKNEEQPEETPEDQDIVDEAQEAAEDAVDEGSSSLDNVRSCFPAHAVATLADGSQARMDALRLGDSVAVGAGRVSTIFAFTHRDADSRQAVFLRATTASGAALVATPGHYVYANGRMVPMSSVRQGDVLSRADGGPDLVVSVSEERADGLFNPQTVDGDLVVGGFVVTTYTTAVEPAVAHAILAPMRAMFEWFGVGVSVVDPAAMQGTVALVGA